MKFVPPTSSFQILWKILKIISVQKQKIRIDQKFNQLFNRLLENCPSDIVNFEKIFKNYEDFLLKITGNS